MSHATQQNAPYRPEPMYIRRATMQDVHAIAHVMTSLQEIHVAARPDVFKSIVVDDDLLDYVGDQLNDSKAVTFIGEVNNVVIGYAYVVIHERPETAITWSQQLALVDQVGIVPAYRGLGYGELLMRRVIDFAREHGLARVALNVWTFNEGAIDFYERLGFRIFMHRMELAFD